MPTSDKSLLAPLAEDAGPNRARLYTIGRVAVLGAGTMGARIAAHIANAGLPVLLLDMVPATGGRSSLAEQALLNLKTNKPAAFVSLAAVALLTVGNFDDDLASLHTCDWIIEAVAENLDIKRSLVGRVAQYLHPTAILTTNTSGLRVAKIAEHLPEALQRRWFGTHFFNPPRLMRLVEIIATPEADPAAVQAIADFCDRQLGKEVVPSNDVQNFIANRVGIFALLNTVRLMQQQGLGIEEIDVLTGPALGWPKSGTFRLADMVGIDVLGNVARNFLESGSDERPDVVLPELFVHLIERKWLGDKTRQGFYKKGKGTDGTDTRLVLDPATFEYVPASTVSFPLIDQAAKIGPVEDRVKALLAGDPARGRAAKFFWTSLPELWAYAANRIGEVSESLVDIDGAITAGFNWELGPFAMWDAAGVEHVVSRMREMKVPIPTAVETLLAAGGTSWYRANGTEYFDVRSGTYLALKQDPQRASVGTHKRTKGVFAGNAGISLVDIGEGIGCFELHSKMNSLGDATVAFLTKELQVGSRAVRNFDGFVISTDAQNFSVGANLKQLLASAQNGRWDEVKLMIQHFQDMTQAVKFCSRPVVAAPAGLCLGGGCEMSMHAAQRQPHLELYAGLVETGVGLIPGGGGCKEMLLRATLEVRAAKPGGGDEWPEMVKSIRNVFETITMARVSMSAPEARSLRLISEVDCISMNRTRLISDARQQALQLVRNGFSAAAMRDDIAVLGTAVFATLKHEIDLHREGGFISDHDVTVATHVAKILSGGDVPPGTLLSEQHLLEAEREAFISLCGEPKTQERMAFTLKTGKPLRN